MKTNPESPITGCSHGGNVDLSLKGLTKREWFAGMIIQAVIQADAMTIAKNSPLTPPDEIVKNSLILTDALIAGLNK